jgi:ribosomal 50S subunit-recycling heat shock protein
MANLPKIFAPHRGTVTVMASKSSLVLKNGELFIEAPAAGVGKGHSKIKIGDGTTQYSALPYALGDTSNDLIDLTEDTSTTADAALAKVVNGAALKTDIAALKKAIALVAADQAAAFAFGTVSVDGVDLAADSVGDTINITAGDNVTLNASTATNTLTITATDTTYENATTAVAGLMSETDKAKLDGIEAGAQVNQNALAKITVDGVDIEANAEQSTVTIEAGSNVTVTPDATTRTLTIAATDTTYENATTAVAGLMSAADKTKLDGVEAGAQVNTITGVKGDAETDYRTGDVNITKANIGLGNVDNTADANKVVASAGKLTTPVDISLTGGVTGTASFDGSVDTEISVSSVDVAYLSGTISIDNLPAGALERVVVVADEAARLALTTDDVQNGDTVKQNDTGTMYFVKDQTKLGGEHPEEAFLEYTAGSATSVPWSGVTNKPEAFPPAEHTHLYAGSQTAGGAADSALEADHASTATYDDAGQQIDATYIKGISANATTVTVTYGNGTTATFETQDTDTTYENATTAVAGLMSETDKAKLDGIETGAEVNQNAFANIVVGDDTIAAGAKQATFNVAAGDNVTLNASTATNTLTITATDTTYENATTAEAGLMSATDKAKLDGVSANAKNVAFTQTLDDGVAIGTITIDGVGTTLYCEENTDTHYASTTVVGDSSTATTNADTALTNGNVYINHVENGEVVGSHKITGANSTTVTTDLNGNIVITGMGTDEVATHDANGLMSAADKVKLDSVGDVTNDVLYLDFGEETISQD